MRRYKGLILALFIIGCVKTVNADTARELGVRWNCVTDQATGVLISKGQSREAKRFEFGPERNFVLTIAPATHPVEWCNKTIKHWTSAFDKNGRFPADKFQRMGDYDYRFNIGQKCFSSNQALIKFPSSGRNWELYNFDFDQNNFVGMPGIWLALFGSALSHATFVGSFPFDAGPVVFSGSCNR